MVIPRRHLPNGGLPAATPRRNRRGAALVVALGLLSLVLLLVTTFVLVMRSDRISASASRAHAYGRECSSLAPYFVGCYLLPQPHDTLRHDTTNYFLPRTDWLDHRSEGEETVSDGEDTGDSGDDSPDALVHAYGARGLSVREYGTTFRDGIAAIEGAEISGQEAVFLGPDSDAAFATLPAAVTNHLPRHFLDALSTNALPLRWQYVQSVNADDPADARLAVRITLLAADLSGQADVHALSTNQWRLAGWSDDDAADLRDRLNEEGPLSSRPDLVAFLRDSRDSIPDATLDALGFLSLDSDPFQLPYGAPIGSDLLRLTNRLDLCSLTNSTPGAELVSEPDIPSGDDPRYRWHDAAKNSDDLRDYLHSLSNALFRTEPLFPSGGSLSNATARALFWNLLNDLDADRYPQTDSASPWLDEYGVEALPLLSELCVTNAPDASIDTDDFGFIDDCPACRALRDAYEHAADLSYRASAELWHPFASTNGIPDPVYLALHLYKSVYTNDAEAVLSRIEDNLSHVVDVVEAHWGTNVVRTSYTHARNEPLSIPDLVIHTLSFDSYAEGNATNLAISAGIVSEDTPQSLEGQVLAADIVVTNDVTLTVSTNAAGRLVLFAHSLSETPPLHLYDNLLNGPSGSLLAGTTSLEYFTIYPEDESPEEAGESPAGPEEPGDSSADPEEPGESSAGPEEPGASSGSEEPGESPAGPSPLYLTLFTFEPDDQDALEELLATLNPPPEEEPSSEEPGASPADPEDPSDSSASPEEAGESPTESENPGASPPSPEEPDATPASPEDAGESPAESEDPSTTPADPEDPGESPADPSSEEPSEPPSLTLPLISAAHTNDFGEVIGVVSITPASDPLLAIAPYLDRFLRTDIDGESVRVTEDATRRRYDIQVHYTVRHYGPSSGHGTRGLASAASDALVADITPDPFRINNVDFSGRFACVSNDVIRFEAPAEHSVWNTNGVCIARHSVSNLLPIGAGAITNVVFQQKPGSAHDYDAIANGAWVADFHADDFTETNLVQSVASTLFLGAQLFLDRPELRNLLPDSGDSPSGDPPFSAESPLDLSEAPYDEAPGTGSDDDHDNDPSGADPWLIEIHRAIGWSVDDPRFNGRTHRWRDASSTPLAPPDRFPGRDDEDDFLTFYPRFAGYPILHRDGLPSAIGDIGYLGTDDPWETLDLFQANGAKLLDLWAVGIAAASNTSRRAVARIHPQTPFPMAAALLFADTRFGTNRLDSVRRKDFCDLVSADSQTHGLLHILTNAVCSIGGGFHPAATNSLLLASIGHDDPAAQDADLDNAYFPFAQWLCALAPHLLDADSDAEEEDSEDWRSSPLARALDEAASDTDEAYACEIPGLDRLEDLVRDLPERVTFRQNIVLVASRTDSLAPNGRITSTSHAIHLLYRDSWTGRWHEVNRIELR